MKKILFIFLGLGTLSENINAKEICSQCFWEATCGSIEQTGCYGGARLGAAGVLWTDGTCQSIGANPIPKDKNPQFKFIYDIPECKFVR